MDIRVKIVLAAAPFLLALYVWFSLASPILSEGQSQDGQLEEKRTKEVELKTKLLDYAHQQKERTALTKEIEQLRGFVPKDPEIDVLAIDLEKMALDSGMDMVSMEKPSADKIKKYEDVQPAQASKPKAPDRKEKGKKADAGAKSDKPVETGLSKVVLSVDVIGDYENFISFMKKLEAYERVIGVTDVNIDKKKEEKKKDDKAPAKMADYKLLNISMVITAYYLP